MAKPKAKYVSPRGGIWIVGRAELMGYLGIETYDKVVRDYIDKGLYPNIYENTERWKAPDVDRWIDEHNQFQVPEIKERKRYTRKRD